ncbi:MAG: multidrug efflux RND transporter permease subunit [Holosporaceae bacterium]|jgi:hydrophobe/amphiphile efflux-1 (HAE1) family protein|nr:multidrug efflux RND transporter permease subunit [Holosporaceae bacterium]
MFSRFFIDRPIFASVVSLVVVIAGFVAMNNLPVAQYPELTPPTIMVASSYPGASAETISETVLAPLEQKINGVEDMIYMNSVASGNGGSSTTMVFFKVGADPDKAMINVNNRVQMVMSSLPEEVRKYGVTVAKRSSAILKIVALYSDDSRYDATYVCNYALLNIIDELKRVEGVGDAAVMGGNAYAMRIWLKPDRLAKLGLGISEVAAAVSAQNSQRAAGAIGKKPTEIKVNRSYMIEAPVRYSTVKEFEDIILRANPDGTSLRLKDVADVELGSQSYDVVARTKGQDTTPIMIFLSPGANALETAERVDKKLTELATHYPKGIRHKIIFDTSGFVRHSIKEVVKTLLEAIGLVFLVVLLFLKNLRATIIPCLAVPVSIIGAFAGMMLLGYSINTLTLFGLVLAIGIVVDDAIIVIENVERLMRSRNLSARDATIEAMQEVSGALVAIVLVLCAVFIPVSFTGGLAGTMYRQFAITIAVSVVLSGICALTLTPALCAIFLRSHSSKTIGEKRFSVWFDDKFGKLTAGYTRAVEFFLKHGKLALLAITAISVATAILFKIVPGSLLPEEDQGVFMSCAIMDPAASLDRSIDVIATVDRLMSQDSNVRDSAYVAGYDMLSGTMSTNAATMFFILNDWDTRTTAEQSAQAMAKKVMFIGSKITDGIVLAFCPPPIVGMSTTGGFEAYVQQTEKVDGKALEAKIKELVAAAAKRPELTRVSSTFNASTPQFRMIVDNLKALSLNIPINEIYAAMAATFNSVYINDFSRYGRGYKVIMQAKGRYRTHSDQINEVYVKSTTGAMVPLSAVVRLTPVVGSVTSERFNVFPAAKIMGNPAPGYSSGEAIHALEDIAKQVLGDGYMLSWTGSAYQEKEAGGSSGSALLLGLLVVFLILAAQYERWTLPIAIIMAVPFAMFGAILAVCLRGYCNDIYFQIALVTLVGLSSKNAILIVEFAVMLRRSGETLFNSALKAAQLRFRPIVMTSLAFILGCLPLAIGSGAGSASRHSLGTGVIGGMLGATLLAPLFIPLFYVWITDISEKFWRTNKNA